MRFAFVLTQVGCLMLLIASSCHAETGTLKPFATDGCSMWIDGTPSQPYLWRHCCVAHDKSYWMGGSLQERRAADDKLRACVADQAGKAMAGYMYFFVRSGGSPYWLTPYRWGYGWSYMDGRQLRGYKTLTGDELEQLNHLLPSADQVIANDAATHPVTKATAK